MILYTVEAINLCLIKLTNLIIVASDYHAIRTAVLGSLVFDYCSIALLFLQRIPLHRVNAFLGTTFALAPWMLNLSLE